MRLPDWNDREYDQADLMREISRNVANVPGVQIRTRSSNSLNTRGGGSGLGLAVTGNDSENLMGAAKAPVAAMAQDDIFLIPQLSNTPVSAELQVRIDPFAARDIGLAPSNVTSLVSAIVQGDIAVNVFENDEKINVTVLAGGPPIEDPSDVAPISIRLKNGSYVPLSSIATLDGQVTDTQIARLGDALSVALQANLGIGVNLSTAMQKVQQLADDVLPNGVGFAFTGDAATLKDSAQSIFIVFATALVVVSLGPFCQVVKFL